MSWGYTPSPSVRTKRIAVDIESQTMLSRVSSRELYVKYYLLNYSLYMYIEELSL